jgi:hypothetical protein
MHAWTGQRSTNGWPTAGDLIVTPSGFGTTLNNFGDGGGPLVKSLIAQQKQLK